MICQRGARQQHDKEVVPSYLSSSLRYQPSRLYDKHLTRSDYRLNI